MEQGTKKNAAHKSSASSVDPYRQLIELQKQMIKLAQQNERVRQECAKLRERVADEAIPKPAARHSLRHQVKQTLNKLPGMTTAKSNLVSLATKEPSAC